MKQVGSKAAPFIIGLTGAIGTGKSLVRKMLEHKGALTIDADLLAHETYKKGRTGFHLLVQHFGKEILGKNGQVDRKRLGELVFRNPQALIKLEKITHPLVTEAIKRIIDLSPLPIIVIEAIKLLQSDLREFCNVIWAVSSTDEDIYQRIYETRGMDRAYVDERLGNQPIQQIDKSQVDIIINNYEGISSLWADVTVKWGDLSRKSKSFCNVLNVTGELLKPFRVNFIQPDNVSNTQVISEINNRGLFFLPVRNLFSGHPQNVIDKDRTCLEKIFYQYFLWRSEETTENTLYMISDMDNFTATSAASVCSYDPVEFNKIIGVVEDFSRLHLCERLFYPFNRERIPDGEVLGFENSFNDILPAADLTPLGYNLLCKQLRPPLDLFREN